MKLEGIESKYKKNKKLVGFLTIFFNRIFHTAGIRVFCWALLVETVIQCS